MSGDSDADDSEKRHICFPGGCALAALCCISATGLSLQVHSSGEDETGAQLRVKFWKQKLQRDNVSFLFSLSNLSHQWLQSWLQGGGHI